LLRVGRQYQVNIVRLGAQVFKRLLDCAGMVDREIDTPRTPAFMEVLLHRFTDSQIVDNRNHLAKVLGEQPVEQYRVAVVKRSQVEVLPQRIRQPLILGVGALGLCNEGADGGWKQAGKA